MTKFPIKTSINRLGQKILNIFPPKSVCENCIEYEEQTQLFDKIMFMLFVGIICLFILIVLFIIGIATSFFVLWMGGFYG